MSHWLTSLANDMARVGGVELFRFRSIGFRVIYSDFSWAFIHASIHAFMRTSVEDYMLGKYTRLTTIPVVTPDGCVLVTCVSHFTARVARTLSIKNRRTRDAFLRCLCLIQLAQNVDTALDVWSQMVTVFGTTNHSAAVDEAWEDLDHRLRTNMQFNIQETLQEIRSLPSRHEMRQAALLRQVEATSGPELRHPTASLRANSPFRRLFADRATAPCAEEDGSGGTNLLAAQASLRQLERLWLPLFPLWSHAVLQATGVQGRVSNAAVETYFRWIKQQHGVGTSSGGRHIRINRFVTRQQMLTERRRVRNLMAEKEVNHRASECGGQFGMVTLTIIILLCLKKKPTKQTLLKKFVAKKLLQKIIL
jgi:hypothetical protein